MNSIMVKRPKKNLFDLTHDHKTTFDMGQLIPTTAIQCVPGDKFHIGCETLVRFQPLIAPVMHRMDVFMHYFFIPFRLLWENWEDYITSGVEGSDVPAHPFIVADPDDQEEGTLNDYLGVPIANGAGQTVNMNLNAFYWAAYQKVWADYYRDQNQQDDETVGLLDGDNEANKPWLLPLRRRAWEHDYFTSALPWAQKGGAVEIPIGGFDDVPVAYNTSTTMIGAAHIPAGVVTDGISSPQIDNPVVAPVGGLVGAADTFARTSQLAATTSNINDLRTSIMLQEWLEKNARSGTRYVESILAHFGVRSSDQRLQRPEFITGTKTPVIISEILQTSASQEEDITSPQGNMAGHGIAVTGGQKYGHYYCEEHGLIMGIMSVMPKTAYNNGIERMLIRPTDRFEYFWPEFANIGEQPVYNAEVYAFTNTALQTFGYMPRYSQYKTMHSRNSADMRTNLRFWTFTRNFAAQPALNEDFITCVPSTDPFAVTGTDTRHLIAHVLHKITAIRPMPKFGTPTF